MEFHPDPADGQKTCPKHVEFYSKNKFEKLVHLFGFIIRIYHYARSSECQKRCVLHIEVLLEKLKALHPEGLVLIVVSANIDTILPTL